MFSSGESKTHHNYHVGVYSDQQLNVMKKIMKMMIITATAWQWWSPHHGDDDHRRGDEVKLADFDLACEGLFTSPPPLHFNIIRLIGFIDAISKISWLVVISWPIDLQGLSTEMAGTADFLAPEVPLILVKGVPHHLMVIPVMYQTSTSHIRQS